MTMAGVSMSGPKGRRRVLDGRRALLRGRLAAARVSLRSRFLVGLLAVVAVADLATAVSFYYQGRQHSITETILAEGRQMHRLSDFQFGVGRIASQQQPLAAADVRGVRSNLGAYERLVVAGRADPTQQRLLHRTARQLDALLLARARLDRLPAALPQRAGALRLVARRAAALTATMANSHARLDMRMDAADATSHARAAGALRAFIAGTAIATLAALLLAIVLANRITAPLLRLAMAARELAAGRLRHPLPVDSGDEIGVLAAEFNRMAAQVEEAQGTLERGVSDRTRQLASANRELERHRVAQERLAGERRRLLGRLIAVQEDERTRISRELHDEAGQSLTAIRLGLEAADVDLRAGRGDACSSRLATLRGAAADAITELERLVLDLRPAQLDHLGLVATLHWYVHRFDAGTPTTAVLEITGRPRRLDPRVETALFRIVQEALTNVARHAAARHVDVVADFSPAHVALEVRDDGVGFDSQAATVSPASVGLLGMREHAELVGGVLTVTSSPGRGTLVRAQVPTREALS